MSRRQVRGLLAIVTFLGAIATMRAADAPAFDAARAWSHLQKQVAFGPRPSGSAALKRCRDYMAAELKRLFGVARDELRRK